MARYARVEVALILLLGGAATIACAWWWSWVAIGPALLTLALLGFYRDPHREPTQADDLLLAPADGRIMRVERNVEPESGDGPRELRIAIFLSVFNVHVNRSPCAARVIATEHTPGKYLNALREDATRRNESNRLTLDPKPPIPGPLHVRQIAGLIARRIVCAVRPGDELSAGERFGMIKLGSQTEVRAPEHEGWTVLVQSGDNVKAGLSVLARIEPRQDAP